MNIEQIAPAKSQIEVSGKKYNLNFFTLAEQVWSMNEFATPENKNGIEILSGLLIDLNPRAIAKLTYRLLEDKSDFITEERFINTFKDTYTLISVLLAPLNECLTNSQPPELTEDEIDLKK